MCLYNVSTDFVVIGSLMDLMETNILHVFSSLTIGAHRFRCLPVIRCMEAKGAHMALQECNTQQAQLYVYKYASKRLHG